MDPTLLKQQLSFKQRATQVFDAKRDFPSTSHTTYE